ncbi:unnamed protein product [Allacma fusca]|uniref:G-protein coupled receptors family 1 profile domain-containing protein n=1 Tax=Allacma fusca TaxID=39272 RepID=A0A8J2JQ48_9HEXA|nr:unnamed protein product [Allacma fusca]
MNYSKEVWDMSKYQPCPQLQAPPSTYDPWRVFIVNNVIVLISFLGLIGNVISGIVLSMPQMRSSYGLLLTALTVSDSIQLLSGIVMYGAQSLWYCGITLTPANTVGPTFSKLLSMIGYVAYTASAYLTALLSFERYTAICWPFKALRIFPTKRRSFYYVIGVSAYAILFNLPKWFETTTCQDRIPIRNSSLTPDKTIEGRNLLVNSSSDEEPVFTLGEIKVIYNELYNYNLAYRLFYLFLANFLINFVIPLVVIIILNIRIYNGMRRTTQLRQLLTVGQINENSITLMLVVVVGIFCASHMWFAVKIVIQQIWGKQSFPKVLIGVTNFLLAFNASINFVIYCLCGSKFRQQLSLLFTCSKSERFSNKSKYDGNRSVRTETEKIHL